MKNESAEKSRRYRSFLPAEASLGERAGVAAMASAIDASWYCFAAAVLAGTGAAERLRAHATGMDRGLGLLLIAVALGLLWGG